MQLISSVALLEPATVPRVVPSDADDDHVIAAAADGPAHLLYNKTYLI